MKPAIAGSYPRPDREVFAMDIDPLSEQEIAAARRTIISANTAGVLTIGVVFSVLIGVGLYATTDRAALLRLMGLSGAGGISGAGQSKETNGPIAAKVKSVPLVGAANLAPQDPVLRFAETRIGQVLFTSTRSNDCRRALFDNRTGASFDVKAVFCGQTADDVVEVESPNRLQALRGSFQK
jgi:hypothetical protein